jgi:hypothetical protein
MNRLAVQVVVIEPEQRRVAQSDLWQQGDDRTLIKSTC